MQDTISELWIQTGITATVVYDILSVLTLLTQEVQVACGRFTYRTTALLSEMYISSVRAGCKIRMASYTSRHASESLCDKPFLRAYTHNLKSTGPIRPGGFAYRTTALRTETFFVYKYKVG